MLVLLSISTVTCNGDKAIDTTSVAGTYTGTLVSNTASKNTTVTALKTAEANVRMHGDQIEVVFTDGDFHHSIMLNIFDDGDFIRPCLTGDAFESIYNHISSGSNFMNDMMSSMTGTDWSMHLNVDHKDNDKHFGQFNLNNNSFEYAFMVDQMEYHFNGVK